MCGSNRHLLNAALMARFCTILLEILSSTRQDGKKHSKWLSTVDLHCMIHYCTSPNNASLWEGRQGCERGNFNRSNPSIQTATSRNNIWVCSGLRCVIIFQRCCASVCLTAYPSHHIPVVPAAIPFADAVVGYHMLPKPY